MASFFCFPSLLLLSVSILIVISVLASKSSSFPFYLFLAVQDLFCWVGFSLVVVSRGCSLLQCVCLLWWLCCCGAQALGHVGSSGCGSQALEHMGFVAPQQVGSFWTGDQTHVSGTGKQSLHHWATRESLSFNLLLIICCGVGMGIFFLGFKLYFKKAEEPEIKLPTFSGS